MNHSILLSLCIVLGVVAVFESVEAAPREKRQILGAILENILGEGRVYGGHSGEHYNRGYGGHSDERFGGEYGRYGYPVYNQGFRNYYPGYGGYSQEHGGGYRHSHEIY